MSVSRSYSGSVSASVTAGSSAEVGAVLAKAQVSIGAQLSTSNSTSATNTYSRNITPGKYGNAQYVSHGHDVSYTKRRLNRDCSTTTLGSGRIKFPSPEEGWY